MALIAPAGSVGQEPPQCLGETATIVGTAGPDHLKGTSHKDVILALGGDDAVKGRGGDDLICGGDGADELDGGRGNDQINDGDDAGSDELVGGPGDDRLYGNLGDDVIDGGRGNDQLFGGNGDDETFHPGRDRLNGGPGDDFLDGGLGDDELEGGRGDDTLQAGDGDDKLFGNPGDDQLFGGGGDDELNGGRGDDLLDGGPGNDEFEGGPGKDTIVDEPPPPPDTLTQLIDAGDRAGIRTWASSQSIATLNSEVAALDQAHRDRLAEVVLDSNATGADRDKMLRVFTAVLAQHDLGFYAEIWSYTFIELTGGGFFGTCNHLFISPDAFAGLNEQDAIGVLMHESFHSFNCVNGGPVGALDEGSAIWIAKIGAGFVLSPGESFTEATYGTKLYYRDLNGQPDYPLAAPTNPTQKLIDVYTWLSANDPSKLPWNSNDRLVGCFNTYFADLNRNVDFFAVWLPAVKERTDLMLADAGCKPL
jgi:hypothetical protein